MEVEPMAVSAPDITDSPTDQAAHVPIVADSPATKPKPKSNGNGNGKEKRAASGSTSEEDDKPLAKKQRGSLGAGKKRRIMDSDSEEEIPIKKERKVCLFFLALLYQHSYTRIWARANIV